ncbi:MAG TPA: LysR family transcriptional regulator [Janthinobacterium sp.]|nr:LysR family transcriptional regulator [Janthinobacterium sp.]
MQMSDLVNFQDMALFVEVARQGSFSRASAHLAVPAATLSRRIGAMERAFGVRLFVRSTRRVELSEAGRRYFERCAHLVDEARLAQEALREVAERPGGHLRLSMPVDLGVHVLGPLLAEFARLYPGISFELDLSPRHADLLGEHVDIALRLGGVKGDQLVARRLGWVEQALFAAPAYLDARGRPAAPSELAGHDCIHLTGPQRQARWCLRNGEAAADVTVSGRFAVNNHGLMQVLAERGLGVAALTPALVREAIQSGRLSRVLPLWSMARLPIHAVTHSRLLSAGARALLDFLARRLDG